MTRSDATMKYGRSSRVADGNQASSDSEISELGEDKQQVSVKWNMYTDLRHRQNYAWTVCDKKY